MAAVLCGACVAFLKYNWDPRPYTWVTRAACSSGSSWRRSASDAVRQHEHHHVGVPVLVLASLSSTPALVIASRAAHRLPIYVGGRDHSSHRLLRLGMDKRQAVAVPYLVSAVSGSRSGPVEGRVV